MVGTYYSWLREGAIHEALALPNAPCRQGLDVTESGKIFSEWLYLELLTKFTICLKDNGLNCGFTNGIPTYYCEILIRVSLGNTHNA